MRRALLIGAALAVAAAVGFGLGLATDGEAERGPTDEPAMEAPARHRESSIHVGRKVLGECLDAGKAQGAAAAVYAGLGACISEKSNTRATPARPQGQ
jgi:hypothetical protein